MRKQIDLTEFLIEQRDAIRDWIDQEAPHAAIEQRHLVEDAPERAYWHHGYQAALDDMIRQLDVSSPSAGTAGRSN